MKGILEKEIEEICPVKDFSVRKYDDPWITNEIIELIRDKDDLIRLAKRSKNKEDWEAAKKARNFVSGQLRNLKAEFV